MQKVFIYSLLLIIGLVGSQILPFILGDIFYQFDFIISFLTLICLAIIMIHVGYEFEIDKNNLSSYGWDYLIAGTAATFPWILCAIYFVLVLTPPTAWSSFDNWKEALLTSRFASPTSAGVLFSMLAAAGLSVTWVFKKARILAIFDDLDTVLLMIPLKMMMVGFRWQLGIHIIIMAVLLWLAWRYLHQLKIPVTWKWVLSYAVIIVVISEIIYKVSKFLDDVVPIHIEILLPAFVLGCMMARPKGKNPHSDDSRIGHQEGLESEEEQKIASRISAIFMVLVGLSTPLIFKNLSSDQSSAIYWIMIGIHVLLITVIINIGKMFPVFCYRKEVSFKERLALSVALFPRGEVGAGVILVSLSYGIAGPMITIAVLSLALNLILTGLFISWVKNLIRQPNESVNR